MNQKKLWGSRFEKSMHPDMFNISKSTHFDWRLALIDIIQSSVHLKGLLKNKIINQSEYEEISNCLKEILKQNGAVLNNLVLDVNLDPWD